MTWVKSFYLKQAELNANCCYHAIDEYNKKKVEIIKARLPLNSSILDIGAEVGKTQWPCHFLHKE